MQLWFAKRCSKSRPLIKQQGHSCAEPSRKQQVDGMLLLINSIGIFNPRTTPP